LKMRIVLSNLKKNANNVPTAENFHTVLNQYA